MSRSRSLAGALQSGVVINEDSADVDFRVESNGSTYALFVDGGSNHVNVMTSTDLGGVLNVSGNAYIQHADNSDTLTLESTDGDANSGPNLRLYRNSSSPADNDFLGTIDFEGRNDNSEDFVAARIFTFTPDGSEDAQLQLSMMKGGSSHIALEIKPDEFIINNGSVDIDFRVESNSGTHTLFVDGGNDAVGIGSSTTDRGLLNVNHDNTGDAFSGSHIALTYDVSPTNNDSKAGISYATSDSDNYGYFQGAERTTSGNGSFVLRYHNNSAGGTKVMEVNAAGAVSKFLQPAFLARPSGAQNNVTEGSGQTVVFGTEVFDQGSDFSSNTFTAPVTGRYQLNTIVYLGALDTDADYTEISILTSNRNYHAIVDPGVFASDPVYWAFTVSVLADMDANDTSTVRYNQVGGVAQTDIKVDSFFSGYLVA